MANFDAAQKYVVMNTVYEVSKRYFTAYYWAQKKLMIVSHLLLGPEKKRRLFATRCWALKKSDDYLILVTGP
jgi:hypothetical protein